MYDLEQAITDRRSIRMFQTDRPVPRQLVDEALELAVRAPSNSNIQPWHLELVSGPALQRLVAALMHEARAKPPVVPQLPQSFAHRRGELGAVVYGSMGITRDDIDGRREAVLRNWEFFRAPLAGVVCMHRDLDYVDSLGRRDVPADVRPVVDRAWSGHLCAGLDRGLPPHPARAARHPARVHGSCADSRSAIRTPTSPPTTYTSSEIRSSDNVVFHDY